MQFQTCNAIKESLVLKGNKCMKNANIVSTNYIYLEC